jgi:hypothetical protein
MPVTSQRSALKYTGLPERARKAMNLRPRELEKPLL